MTQKETTLLGIGREPFLTGFCKALAGRLTNLLAAAVHAVPQDPGPALGSGRGVTITGTLAAGTRQARFAAFLDERSALAFAGALLGAAPGRPQEAIAALAPFAGEIAHALASGAGVDFGGKPMAEIEDVQWSERAPAAGAERAGVRLTLGEIEGAVTIELSPEDHEEEHGRPSEVLLDLELPFALRLGSVEMELGEIQQLEQGAVIPLGKAADSAVSLVVGGRVIARGELVVVDGCFGVQIESVETAERRLKTLARV